MYGVARNSGNLAVPLFVLFIGYVDSARTCYSSQQSVYVTCSRRDSCCSSYNPCCANDSLTAGPIIGIVIACLFLIGVIALFVFVKYKMDKRKKQFTQIANVHAVPVIHPQPRPLHPLPGTSTTTSYGHGGSNRQTQNFPPPQTQTNNPGPSTSTSYDGNRQTQLYPPTQTNDACPDPVYPPPPPISS